MSKSADAFRTIGEVADELDVPKHVLRFWEGKFPHIKPMKRGGGRRYYRPEDMELLRGIRHLLHAEGYTIKGVQKILREHGVDQVKQAAAAAAAIAEQETSRKRRRRKDAVVVDTANTARTEERQRLANIAVAAAISELKSIRSMLTAPIELQTPRVLETVTALEDPPVKKRAVGRM
jgi:DNA-binding transcriptional MerR regulator